MPSRKRSSRGKNSFVQCVVCGKPTLMGDYCLTHMVLPKRLYERHPAAHKRGRGKAAKVPTKKRRRKR